MTCKNCEHYDLDRVKSKSGAISSGKTARCRFPMEDYIFPAAFSINGWTSLSTAHLNYMSPNDGEECKTFSQRTEK